jgi:hypothetical protein
VPEQRQIVPLDALGDAITNLAQVFEAGKPKEEHALDQIMVDEFHDQATDRLDSYAVARGLGISVRGLAVMFQ